MHSIEFYVSNHFTVSCLRNLAIIFICFHKCFSKIDTLCAQKLWELGENWIKDYNGYLKKGVINAGCVFATNPRHLGSLDSPRILCSPRCPTVQLLLSTLSTYSRTCSLLQAGTGSLFRVEEPRHSFCKP